MYFNPEFHAKNGTPWLGEDVRYLIQWYDKIGPEEMSFALERTIKTIQEKAYELRKKGLMPKSEKKIWNKRMI